MTVGDAVDDTDKEERCPPWCVADHQHQGNADQRWHYSACVELPLVELAPLGGVPGEKLVDTAVAFDVALERPWGSTTAYVLLGVGSERVRTFCLTLESAERLVAAVQDAVRVGKRSA
ncbi:MULTISPECIES: hypothetical protein [Microbacterium]|uniref:DUF6907 domain-containing protein n=1 Tax=Microbacterium TaxID=33882 RepID=UPI002788BAFF|nr:MULTISPECIES: hypothetical protein [Microbacterium]MDQ1084688.1 hypothetical protein [Microbacterium sp. SORGH_AS_0344]MDQ1170035.1 hypothetical protein [Microbacterium proteolyticum]